MVYEATGPIMGAPDSSAPQNGWTIALVAGAATGYRTNGVLCDSADTTGYDPTIVYDDNDLAIFYRRSDAQTITHTGENAEIHIFSGSVIKPDDGNTDPAVGNDEGAAIAAHATSDTDASRRRIFVGQGATVANNDVTALRREERPACTYDQLSRMECGTRTPGSPPLRVSATAYIVDVVVPGHAIDMSVLGMGTLTAIIQGSVSAAAGRGINLRSDDGDITLNIAGSVRARGERAHAVLATATGAGNVDVDVSGTSRHRETIPTPSTQRQGRPIYNGRLTRQAMWMLISPARQSQRQEAILSASGLMRMAGRATSRWTSQAIRELRQAAEEIQTRSARWLGHPSSSSRLSRLPARSAFPATSQSQ